MKVAMSLKTTSTGLLAFKMINCLQLLGRRFHSQKLIPVASLQEEELALSPASCNVESTSFFFVVEFLLELLQLTDCSAEAAIAL